MQQTRSTELAKLAWRGTLKVWPFESVGRNILHRGVHDLTVIEACFRLTDRGGTAVDVGGHVGQMTSALAHAVGSTGTVIAAEPHPVVYRRLEENVEIIRKETGATIETFNRAICDTEGSRVLRVPDRWSRNRGTASLDGNECGREIEVEGTRLGTLLNAQEVQVLKVDVEGLEAEVFKGATEMLSRNQIRHILFEDHTPAKSAAVSVLQSRGFEVYALDYRLKGPLLQGPCQEDGWPKENYNFVATSSSEDLYGAYKTSGWMCLQ